MKIVPRMPGRPFFEDRHAAGVAMAALLVEKYGGKASVVLGIPRGGVLVAAPVAAALDAPLDVIVPRKIPIPDSPEMGFGAVTADGGIYLNEPLVRELRLLPEEIKALAEEVRREVIRREKVYRQNRPLPDIEGKIVLVVDDGLATGYTMLAALRSLRRRKPALLVAVAPVAPLITIDIVEKEADEVAVMIAQESGGFAVASFYRNFEDLPDEAVIDVFRKKY